MRQSDTMSRFEATLLRPVSSGSSGTGDPWAFVILPKSASAKLPRRGRTTVEGSLDGVAFQATLEPDGQLSHWLRVDAPLLERTGATFGDRVALEIMSAAQEPEPEVPPDVQRALAQAPEALAVWKATTTIARLDWLHWITSAKQAKTREKRIGDACHMLAAGKRRVCCFDPSGYYSKSFAAPQAAE
ncbi:YdeI/OmpD-associated family protein [Halomonas sp. V046]|uniref:YdeI/OmpD-associated family protein n=1 Tax=Halomonas sp. V046 TaxID=3459611 RepID=UPI004043DBB3